MGDRGGPRASWLRWAWWRGLLPAARSRVWRLAAAEGAQDLVEYGLLIALVALAVAAALSIYGNGVLQGWNSVREWAENTF